MIRTTMRVRSVVRAPGCADHVEITLAPMLDVHGDAAMAICGPFRFRVLRDCALAGVRIGEVSELTLEGFEAEEDRVRYPAWGAAHTVRSRELLSEPVGLVVTGAMASLDALIAWTEAARYDDTTAEQCAQLTAAWEALVTARSKIRAAFGEET